ncbi:hypothetical protein C8A00DRAFT_11994 [Chaetomidium leptoderma]|uniref:Fucose-specific lectin n=1 Tax=Chaetomidium leptoderma TaxID=669021 RepID=A0AAN7A016_9PEZI|nr:hypothetical protein C8A00DRAFT_11994 [Chaetomidium leptoderma]
MYQSGRYGHSDLPEAVDYRTGDNFPEAVPSDYRSGHNFPEVVPSDYPQAAQGNLEENKYLAPGFTTQHGDYPTPTVGPQEPGRRILGLQRRTFIILAVICAVVVVALGVGLGVGLSASTHSDPAPSPSPSPTSAPNAPPQGESNPPGMTNLFQGSSLAATNYTDAAGIIHLYVFFQAANKELLASKWDSQNKAWTTLSISKALANTGITLELIPASPIAAYTYTNPTFQTRVYFLTKGNSIREIMTSEDPSLTTGWKQGRLGGDKLITASEGSKLAALRPHCGTSRNCQVNYPWIAIAYQGDGGVMAVSRADGWEPMEIRFDQTTAGAPVGLSSVMRKGNITDIGWSLFYEEGGDLQEFNSELLVTKWTRGPSIGPAASTTSSTTTPNMASFSYDLVNMMVVTVDGEGGLGVRTWDTKSWSTVEPPNLLPAAQAPTNPHFTAIAGHPRRRLYGVVNGTIHEWEFSSLSPLQWSYIGNVSTDDPGP